MKKSLQPLAPFLLAALLAPMTAEARYYDPGSGTFLSRDEMQGSIQDAPSLHRYSYARGNPLRYIDVDGRDPSEATRGERNAALAAANAAEQKACSSGDQAACSSIRGGDAIMDALAAPLVAAAGVVAVESGAVAAAWEGTAGPLVDATATIARGLLARSGARAAFYAASAALARFGDNIINLADEGNALVPVSGPLLRQAERGVARAADRTVATAVDELKPSTVVHMSGAKVPESSVGNAAASEVVAVESARAPGSTTTYYHGTNDVGAERVGRQIDLTKGRGLQDFDPAGGSAFYVTKDRGQAERWARRVAEEEGGNPAIVSFEVADSELHSLSGRVFPEKPSLEWSDFVRKSRSGADPGHHEFDYVEGPLNTSTEESRRIMSSKQLSGRGHQIAVCSDAAACVFDAAKKGVQVLEEE